MSHTFRISIENELSSTLKEVEKTITEQGGEFKGDTHSGEFSGKTILGKVKGQYTYLADDDEIKITIIKKPFTVSKGKIESAIRQYFT